MIVEASAANFDQKYLVIERCEGEHYYKIMMAMEIFSLMELDDLYDIEIDVYKLDGDEVKPCRFRGKWHDSNEPLKMVIEEDGEVIAVGYATEH